SLLAGHSAHLCGDRVPSLRDRRARPLLHDGGGRGPRADRDRNGSLPAHSASLLYRSSHHVARAWTQLYELVESVGPDGECAAWTQLPYPCGRARPTGAARPAVSGVHAAHKTAHPLCPVTEVKAHMEGLLRISLLAVQLPTLWRRIDVACNHRRHPADTEAEKDKQQ